MINISKNINYFEQFLEYNGEYTYLNCPSDYIIPFQIAIDREPITIKFFKKNIFDEEEILLQYNVFEMPRSWIIIVNGSNQIICGVYQIRIQVDTNNYFTNYINFIPSEKIKWKIKYWNNQNTDNWIYSNGFRHVIYGTTWLRIEKSYYKEDVIEKMNGQKFYNMQVIGDVYKPIIFGEKETMKEISILPMFDNHVLEYGNQSLKLFDIPTVEISNDGNSPLYSATVTMIVERQTKTITSYNPIPNPHYLINFQDENLINFANEALIYE